MNGKKRISVTLILALACLGAALPAAAQSDDTTNRWTFELVPLLWASGLDISAQTGAGEQSIDVSFSDIMKDLHFGAQGSFEVRKNRLGFLFDGMYADIRKSIPQSGPMPGDVDLIMKQSNFSLALAYRVVPGRTAVDLLGGARYNYMNTVLEVTSGPLDGLTNTSKDDWVDGFAGVRVLASLAKAWTLVGYADVGAGGSVLTWQAKAGVLWRFSRVLSAELGYRHSYFEREVEEGGDSFKMAKSGFYIGLGIKF